MRLKVPAATASSGKCAGLTAAAQTRSATQCLEFAVITITSGQISTAC